MAAAEPVRVLTLGLPLLVRQMLAAAREHEPGIELVAHRQRVRDLEDEIRSAGADCVIVAMESERLPRACRDYLSERAQVKLLGIREQDGHAFLYRLRPDVEEIGDAAPQELARAITQAYGTDDWAALEGAGS